MQVSFEQRGRADAPMILFIHGGGMDSTVWESSMDFFQSYHCVTVDLPEHGKSASCKPFSIAESAGCIAEFIKTNASFGRAHLVGHSLGGVVLIELLRSSPELIDHAVVCSGNLRPSFLYTVGSNKLFCKFVSAVNRKRYQKDYVNPEMLQRVYREMRQYSILANKPSDS
ncbi:MAG: alpha/beta fold hydrolase [Anaerofustis sp.]